MLTAESILALGKCITLFQENNAKVIIFDSLHVQDSGFTHKKFEESVFVALSPKVQEISEIDHQPH